ncbi:hypothetical protein, partial [Pseudomonas sp. FSL R10-0765]|uniref:hypothetical protein n=1 Tax=Pseudomonas sp. FSL R10-0765 TaxID=2662195 RepID=UPI001C49B9AD
RPVVVRQRAADVAHRLELFRAQNRVCHSCLYRAVCTILAAIERTRKSKGVLTTPLLRKDSFVPLFLARLLH